MWSSSSRMQGEVGLLCSVISSLIARVTRTPGHGRGGVGDLAAVTRPNERIHREIESSL